jgi:hypothetical protein
MGKRLLCLLFKKRVDISKMGAKGLQMVVKIFQVVYELIINYLGDILYIFSSLFYKWFSPLQDARSINVSIQFIRKVSSV